MVVSDAWLALARAPGLHADQLRDAPEFAAAPERLVGSSLAALRALRLPPALARWLTEPDERLLAQDRHWLRASGASLLCFPDARFPGQLRGIADAPLALYVLGDAGLLQHPQIGIVGTRKPTPQGLHYAHRFATSLARAGLVITSGLAYGIDRACHEAALAAGRTIAVLGNGLDDIYPSRHQPLAAGILAGGGAVVSEFPPGTVPQKEHFPRRNRLISGLARAVLVIEAAARSGSLITARLAAEQGRNVYAVPGCIDNPMASGCHYLIRQGSTLVESPGQILEELQLPYENQEVMEHSARPKIPRRLDKSAKILLDALGFEPASLDTLVARTGLTTTEVTVSLLLLELEKLVGMQPGGRYVRLGN